MAKWQTFLAKHTKDFQRASSAVEGRNDYLSQMQHNHRGLPKRRYKVWTVLHNFDGHASDRTTSATASFTLFYPHHTTLPILARRSAVSSPGNFSFKFE